MKLSPVLAQYLYARKRLSLPGIGVFQLDPSVYVEQENSKGSIRAVPEGSITFKRDSATKEDSDLIQYISAETGKMKPLAISDLASYLELMQQFLNIGKPFQLEGIGTLTKNSNGQYEFTSGHLLNEKITDSFISDSSHNTSPEDPSLSFRDLYKKQDRAGFTLTKTFIALLLLGGIGVAIWGGYALYNKNKNGTTPSVVPEEQQETVVPVNEDSLRIQAELKTRQEDSLKQAATARQAGYKFIFETTPNKKRAINRHNFLKNINLAIHLETVDSSLFNITVDLDVPASDTLRVKDSLNAWYWGRKDMLVRIASNTSQNVP